MKKFFYILLPVFILDVVFDGEEILKLPFLFQHYVEHQKKDHIGFIDFLVLHYIENHSQSNEHKDLPYKDHQNCAHIHFYFDKVQKVNINPINTLNTYSVIQMSCRFTPAYFSVWHPPKI